MAISCLVIEQGLERVVVDQAVGLSDFFRKAFRPRANPSDDLGG
jgi:hypothetical protein